MIVFLSPLINAGIQSLKKQYLLIGLTRFSIVWFVIPLLTTFVFNRPVLGVANDFIILTFAYVLGAYFRLYETFVMKSLKMNFYMILLATVLMLFSEYLFLLRGEATHNLQILNLTKQFF